MIGTTNRESVEIDNVISGGQAIDLVCPECGGPNMFLKDNKHICVDCKIAFSGEYVETTYRMTEAQKRMAIYTRLPLTSTMFVKVGGVVLEDEDIILAIQGALERNDGLFILSEVPEFNGMYLFKSPDCAIEVMVIDRGHDFLIMLMGYGEISYVEDLIDDAVKNIINSLPYHAVSETVFNWLDSRASPSLI